MEKEIPEFLIKKINEQYSKEETDLILKGLKQERKSTFRINRIKSNVKEIETALDENQIKYSKTEFFEDAFILENNDEQRIRKLDIYKEGKIYIQSLSSMLPILILDPKEKENILDMCAAPRRKNNSELQV